MKLLLFSLFLLLAACSKKTPFLDKRLKTYKYPFKTKIYNYLSQSQKVSMDYLLKEDKKKEYPDGKTVILLHDINTVSAQYKDLGLKFYNDDYRVLIPDLIGMGRSLKPEGYQYSVNGYAFMLKKFIKWYQIKSPVLVGSGLGADIVNVYTAMEGANYSKSFLINPTFFIGIDRRTNYLSIDEMYELELNKSVSQIENFISDKVNIKTPQGEHLLWLHLGTRQGIDWRELAFTRAKIMNHYCFANKVNNKLSPNTHILFGKNASYWPASYLPKDPSYSKQLLKLYPNSIELIGSSVYPEIDSVEDVYSKITNL